MTEKKEKMKSPANRSPIQPSETSSAPLKLTSDEASASPAQLARYKRLVHEYLEKWSCTPPILGLTATRKEENSGIEISGKHELSWALLAKATGTVHWPLAKRLIVQAMEVIKPRKKEEQQTLEEILAAMLEVGPTNGLEGMLAVQIISAHILSIKYLRRAAEANHPEAQKHYQSLAEKAMNLFRRQMDLLTRHRARGQPQRIVVERVNISEGGQALIAGTVAPSAKGGDN